MSNRVTQWFKSLVKSRHMLSGVTFASFLESTIVPVPLEAILLPLMQARRDKLWLIAAMATLGCIIGAVFGYAIGYFLFDLIGDWAIQTLSSPEQWQTVKDRMSREGFWFVLSLGILPIPFQIAMLAAGATQFSLLAYLLATGISRSLRYFGIALAVKLAGNHAERLIKKYKAAAIIMIALLVVVGWWLSR
ncbi:YqaA family protein [Alteromonas oceanisediminis]|uniref:YqaA family protein n=1 Tax=Alteromonas oceanisediminis TaxID=2836180 RepID=UPI001BD929ED|nr:VTT domain-containing protein [Alteromonas oceanisediminis]MBT0587910.1 VTT domain-containing protein [Alteromonas oceanisediminis]